jgi:hypothetical protein
MNKLLKTGLLLLVCMATFSAVHAQSSRADNDMSKFLVGTWSGTGKLANGKTIEADVAFTLATDSSCLISIYADRAPNVFRSEATFGISGSTGKFFAHFINNFTGLKDFTSDGWQDGKIILGNQEDYKGKGTLYQQFIYEKIDNDHFKATYKYGMDSTKLKEGDYLIFTRVIKND